MGVRAIVLPPALRELDLMTAPDSFIEAIIEHNPDIMAKPVILDGFKDTCEKYEQVAAAFLGK